MDNNSVKLSGPVFISPVNVLYRMSASNYEYDFPIIKAEENIRKEKSTGRILKKKKR
ncbi:MAG: hypothetical protein IKI04_01110 [Bacilli bacterium]|nr:hypothetical protein [Bacilli bacterium]